MHGRFSHDGKRVLYTGLFEKNQGQLFVTDLAGGKPRRISQELNGDFLGYCWSPHGKRLAYVWRQGPESEGANQGITESFLMVVNADGSNPKVVLSEKTSNSSGTITLAVSDWR
jgi:Tol biopolymer transport system component